MKWLSKRQKIADERMINMQNKIYKEIYTIVMILCLISIVTKYYLYGIDAKIVTTELIILFVSGIYYTVRAASIGIFSDEVELHDRNSKVPMSSKNVYIGLGLGVIIGLFFGIRSAIVYGSGLLNSIFYFVIVFFATLMIYLPLFLVLFAGGFSVAKKASIKATEKDLDE
ncbi:DUF6773 family protein [Cytobacillus solani]|uniref:Uncharacterized protein n=1 Tax=Cytobacillus solani TaxID=1637975 RepID=A0A0Q3QJ09_9BACI|nr:DUF6773 family protein [Cytobacillus solani]KOP79654.1 hypothetical protein AMS60_17790 [Bacillus sp. FJAT-21945]KQL17552.1 hypothetical protein AN957_02205 [Cytobacillus solani]USK55413.1 hypothetical protein LIS82_02345 [Cytobacillus solani]